jgi:serine/threonine-protein kinase
LFAPDYAYNQDVSALAPDPSSAAIIGWLQADAGAIAAEFPGGEYCNVVPPSQPMVPVEAGSVIGFYPDGGFFSDNAAQRATAAAPIPSSPVFECQGHPNCDHHFMILQTGTCQLFELYGSNPTSNTTGWGIMVQWQLGGSPQIPDNLQSGSTTQAGTPLLPGIIWPAEVAQGSIDHAIDIVMPDNGIAPCVYVHPASTVRYKGADQAAPYGARFRLKANYDTSAYTGTQALVVIRALQKYGMVSTDGSGETRSVFRLGQDLDGGTLNRATLRSSIA